MELHHQSVVRTLVFLERGEEDPEVDERGEEGAAELGEDVGGAVLRRELLAAHDGHGDGDGRVEVAVRDGGRGVDRDCQRKAP